MPREVSPVLIGPGSTGSAQHSFFECFVLHGHSLISSEATCSIGAMSTSIACFPCQALLKELVWPVVEPGKGVQRLGKPAVTPMDMLAHEKICQLAKSGGPVRSVCQGPEKVLGLQCHMLLLLQHRTHKMHGSTHASKGSRGSAPRSRSCKVEVLRPDQ